METRPKMGEKNCTRAAGKSGGGQAGLWAAEMKRLQAVQSARELGRRARGRRVVLEYCRCRAGERANRCTYTHKKDTWYRRRRLPVCVEPVRVRDHAVPKNRHASRPLCLPTPHNTNASRLREIVP